MVEPEDDLQSLLSRAASERRLVPGPTSPDDCKWIGSLAKAMEGNASAMPSDFLSSIAFVATKIDSSFQLHAVSSEALLWEDEDDVEFTPYRVLCLLLCCQSLRCCQNPITKRSKRWKSIMWETIRAFQRTIVEEDPFEPLVLWTHHVLPAVSHVYGCSASDDRNFLMAYFSAIVGTTSSLASLVATSPVDTNVENVLGELVQLLRTTSQIDDMTLEEAVCLYPWRKSTPLHSIPTDPSLCSNNAELLLLYTRIEELGEDSVESIEDLKDSVVHVSMEWDSLGVAYLAYLLWSNRCQSFSSDYTWRLWFPHVTELLNSSSESGEFSCGCQKGISLLRSLLALCNDCSFPSEIVPCVQSSPTSPLGLFNLLSNILVAASQPDIDPTKHQLPPSGDTYNFMRQLLVNYQPTEQVRLVSRLVLTCPHLTLKPKLVDLLRLTVAKGDPMANAAILEFVEEDILTHLFKEHLHGDSVTNVETLIDSVEIYNSGIALVKLTVRDGKSQSAIPICDKLRSFHAAFAKLMSDWKRNPALVSEEGFRLYLLEIILNETMVSIST